MLPTVTGGPTVIPPLLVITVLLGSIHCTTGGMLTSTVQVRLRVSPITAVPDSEMVRICRRSGEVGRSKGMVYQGNPIQHVIVSTESYLQ